MGSVSVSEAARRLGVGVSRIHQRIADGSLRAERLGSQWVIDELSLLRVAERDEPGRPLSARSAWAIIALAEGDEAALSELAAAERARARRRLEELLVLVAKVPRSERAVRQVASALRLMFRNRSERLLFKAATADLARLRLDPRWAAIVSPAASGIAALDVEGYLTAGQVDEVSREHLLVPMDAEADSPADSGANVIIHVLPQEQNAYPESALRLAVDMADRRGPREELRAAELLREIRSTRKSGKR